MDELFELRLRRGLDDMIEPVTGGYPHWESSPAAARVGWGRRRDRLPWGGTPRGRRVAWVLVAAALLAALLAIVGIAGSRRESTDTTKPAPLPAVLDPERISEEATVLVARSPEALAPTGIVILSPDLGDYGSAILDADGETIWLLSPRGLAAFRPADGTARTWTAADDLAFGASAITRARSGGVWLIGDKLRWFDGGDRFLDVVPAPGGLAAAAAAPDGTLWAATGEGVVHHWDGVTWTKVEGGPSAGAEPPEIAVTASGDLWVGATSVGRFDGQAWHAYNGVDAAPLGRKVRSLVPLSDGSVLVATTGGVARFNGTAWSTLMSAADGLGSASSVAVGPDGSLWAAEADSYSGAVRVGRSRNGTWTTWGPADGLPDNQGWLTPSILPTRDAVYAAAGYGLRRLDVDHWTRVWPATFVPGPIWVTSLLPISRDEAWAGDQEGLWHLVDGAWTLEWSLSDSAEGRVSDIALFGGTAWAATTDGLLRLDDDHWTTVSQRPVTAIAAAPDGTLWVGGTAGDANGLWTLRRVGGSWAMEDVPDPPGQRAFSALAVGPDGTVWAGEAWYDVGVLARYDGSRWEIVQPLGPSDRDQAARDIVIAPNGDVWVAVNDVVARYDGGGWTSYGTEDGAVPQVGWETLAIGPDGAAWGASFAGPVRFDGVRWQLQDPAVAVEHIWIAPDGSVWGALPDGVARLSTGDTGNEE